MWGNNARSSTFHIFSLISNNSAMEWLHKVYAVITEIARMMIRITKLIHFHISGSHLSDLSDCGKTKKTWECIIRMLPNNKSGVEESSKMIAAERESCNV